MKHFSSCSPVNGCGHNLEDQVLIFRYVLVEGPTLDEMSSISAFQFDEDFEGELGMPEADFSILTRFGDIPKLGIVDVSGDDSSGRKVISISACRLPSNKSYDHQLLLQ